MSYWVSLRFEHLQILIMRFWLFFLACFFYPVLHLWALLLFIFSHFLLHSSTPPLSDIACKHTLLHVQAKMCLNFFLPISHARQVSSSDVYHNGHNEDRMYLHSHEPSHFNIWTVEMHLLHYSLRSMIIIVIVSSLIRHILWRAQCDSRYQEMHEGSKIVWIVSHTLTGLSHAFPLTFIPSSSHDGNGKHFFLRNSRSGLVMEVRDGNPDPGTEVVSAFRSPCASMVDHQLFYEDDQTGTIRTALNGYCLDVQSEMVIQSFPVKDWNMMVTWFVSDNIALVTPYDPYSETQQWRKFGRKIQHRSKLNMVLQVSCFSLCCHVSIETDVYSFVSVPN